MPLTVRQSPPGYGRADLAGLDDRLPQWPPWPRWRMIGTVKTRPVGLATVLAVALVSAILAGSQLFANAVSPAPDVRPSIPAGSAPDEKGCPASEAEGCGNAHSAAVHAWVECKAEKGKDACTKPAPPGRALGHTKHEGKAPGPASADGHGHGWGRAHAPGQLKKSTKPSNGQAQPDGLED